MRSSLPIETLIAALIFGVVLWFVALNGLTTHPLLCGGAVIIVMVVILAVMVSRHTKGEM